MTENNDDDPEPSESEDDSTDVEAQPPDGEQSADTGSTEWDKRISPLRNRGAHNGPVEELEEHTAGGVSLVEAAKYGRSLLIYIIVLVVVVTTIEGASEIFVVANESLSDFPPIRIFFGAASEIIRMISRIIYLAGGGGLLYKVIADAVTRGME